MKLLLIENMEYELVEDVREGFDETELRKKYTDYFNTYDYIVGDWAYGKLRLKGFYDENNKNTKDLNNFKDYKQYLEKNCAYNCKYFIIKRVYKK